MVHKHRQARRQHSENTGHNVGEDVLNVRASGNCHCDHTTNLLVSIYRMSNISPDRALVGQNVEGRQQLRMLGTV